MSTDGVTPPTATIAIAATFTADPLDESLGFWMDFFGISADVQFAPYNQLFQQLLDHNSTLAAPGSGLNVLLLRLEDWLPFGDTLPTSAVLGTLLDARVAQFTQALAGFHARSQRQVLVCCCPASPALRANAALAAQLARAEANLYAAAHALPRVRCVAPADVGPAYGVTDFDDPSSDQLGRIPYTPTYFAALGTVIFRTFYALYSTPAKVLVLDCDNTLWSGVCGEDGVNGIEILPGHVALQQFAIEQHNAGMLLCVCSKNSESDVLAVFEQRTDMLLKCKHIVAWRVNWQPKSANLRALSSELQLGLESFVVLDDNPLECADMRSACPEALVLQLPSEMAQFPQFLAHIWAFDRLHVTDEDRRRTQLYQQNSTRAQLQAQALTLEDFLAQLDLRVTIAPATAEHYPRIAQLTQRTNQFNLSTIRRSLAEVAEFCAAPDHTCLMVEVCDRFGDYGLVGALLLTRSPAALEVDTFLLSCRVLGKRVEHQMMAHLGTLAQAEGRALVRLHAITTARNQPVRDFLSQFGQEYRQPCADGAVYELPAAWAQAASSLPTVVPLAPPSDVVVAADGPPAARMARVGQLAQVATVLAQAAALTTAIAGWRQRMRSTQAGVLVAPRTPSELQLSILWAQVLGLDHVGVTDDFFVLGGHSLSATRLLARIRDEFQVDLTQSAIFEAPTIAQMAALIDYQHIGQLADDDLDALLCELESLSIDQVQALLEST